MAKKIAATLNLTQALEDFHNSVVKLLEITELDQWNGESLRQREAKIREAALILGGQCIALLIYQLSQLKEVQETALAQTNGWWRSQTQKHGTTPRQILTMGNVSLTLQLPYVVERRKKPQKKKTAPHQGFCPFLRWLALEKGVTALVWSTVAEYGTMRSSFATAQLTLKDWGIDLTGARIQRLTYRFCQEGLSRRRSKVFHLGQGDLKREEVLKGQRVVISVDGGRRRLIFYKSGKRNPKTQRRRYNAEWKEPKLLTIYTVDEQGKKIKTKEIPLTNDGTFGNSKEFLKILEMHLVRLGIAQAQEILFIADGQGWMWKEIPPLLKRLGCPLEHTHYLQDFYHVTEHLAAFAEAAFTDKKEQNKWFKQARSWLKTGQVSTLLSDMKRLRKPTRKQRRSRLTLEINCLTKIWSAGRLNYPQIAALKLPLGSGAIESLIRQVVNLRLKGNGKYWLPDKAESLLHARCQWIAGTWDSFCEAILTARIYPVAA